MIVQYVGHSTILIKAGIEIIIDPYLKGKGREGLSRYNPNAVFSVEELNPDLILLTHGHGDHFGQTLELLERTDAKVVTSRTLCDFLGKRFDKERLLRVEPGQKIEISGIQVEALKAKHRFGLEGFAGNLLGFLAYERFTPCGTNMGYVLSAEAKTIYHSGDTCLLAAVHKPQLAFISMDGLRTMNGKEAIKIIKKMQAETVVPIHYKWSPLGARIIAKVRGALEREKTNTSFREMVYGERMSV